MCNMITFPLADGLLRRSTALVPLFILINTSYFMQLSYAEGRIEKITFCDNQPNANQDLTQRLLYVTTLDGKLSVIDLDDNGRLKWAVTTNPGPLLSSSIHRLELTNNGQLVRMIPSLDGGLYQFDGEHLEAIPINAEHLLSSSFKFSDDLVISGGKETRTYGISSRTGKIIYECSLYGCQNRTNNIEQNDIDNGPTKSPVEVDIEHDPLVDDVIVLRRQTQTIRAIEPRTGGERWNFSVGHHEMNFLRNENCQKTNKNDNDERSIYANLELRFIVPDGIVCAVDKRRPTTILWTHKFDNPIVSAWRLTPEFEVESIDLFDTIQWIWDTDLNFDRAKEQFVSPSIYVGMYDNQLYIQESDHIRQAMNKNIQAKIKDEHMDQHRLPRIPWKPLPATTSAIQLIQDDIDAHNELKTTGLLTGTALSVLYSSDYVNGNGFFLLSDYGNETITICSSKNKSNHRHIAGYDHFMEDTELLKIFLFSFLHWWKEILVLTLTSALILNVTLSHRLKGEREVVIVERHVEIKVPATPTTERSHSDPLFDLNRIQRTDSESSSNNFVSRFVDDFEMIQCLGKGGFGVVFEVRNKLDDCKYAIKRIVLPNKRESRDRVMREVKTLANCEHQNIVRYFHAWVETPPKGWQENEDKLWLDRAVLSHSIDIDSPTDPSTNKIIASPNSVSSCSEAIANNPKSKLDNWLTNLQPNGINFDDELRKSYGTTKDSSNGYSFIEFRAEDDNNDNCDENGNDSVFNSNSEDTDNNPKSKSNFVHVDRNLTVDESKSNISFNTESCSFQIEFKDSQDQRKRATSESIDFSSISKFRKTHRRPMSLDLSKKGPIKIEPTYNNQPQRMYLYIQMQLCRKQSLKEWLRLNDSTTRRDFIVPIFQQIVEAVEYVHLKGLIHRDLKPSNIFFSLDGQIKIGDFGLVASDISDIPIMVNECSNEEKHHVAQNGFHSNTLTQQVGTHLYMSPEQIRAKQYNYKVDIYSLGLIFFELLVVFSTEMERIQTLKALRSMEFPNEFSENFQKEYELLKLMLSEEPNKRPTTFGIRARQPLNHHTNSDWHFELPCRRRDSHISLNSVGIK